jgi:hypothetical protein
MPNNYVLLETVTVGAAGATSVTFNNIPQTGYTDLEIKISARAQGSGSTDILIYPNGSSANLTFKALGGNGASAYSSGGSGGYVNIQDISTYTANTFSNGSIYIPNYTSSSYKSISGDSVSENNATTAYAVMEAVLWSNTAAITSITLDAASYFTQYSTFSLYGIAAVGTTPTIAPKATGGDIIQTDGTYWYHAFRSSGTFTPSLALSCDVLQVAGGGGAANGGGGAGAGGLLYYASQSLTTTGYTVTVGSGGAIGVQGGNSQFAALTASVGGGTTSASSGGNGSVGGSGGGGAGNSTSPAGTGGAGTSGQGNAGGNGNQPNNNAGGGGGAAANGSNATSINAGNGGVGSSTYSSWGLTTGTGQNSSGTYYYAGGGGGYPNGSGGLGGGGGSAGPGVAGTANTGGGAGGYAAAGGSGIVIVRYLVA